MTNQSKADRLLSALMNGATLTPRQIESRFNVVKGRNLIHQLRLRGYVIHTNRYTNSRGVDTCRYELGNPTAEIIAAAYRVLGSTYGLKEAA